MENKKDLLTREEFLAIEEVKAQWLATVDALADPLIVLDKDFKIEKVNLSYSKFVGSDIKSCLGKTCFSLLGREAKCQGCLVEECFIKAQTKHFSLLGLQSEDSYHEVVCQPVLKDNSAAKVVVLYQDKTQEKLIENRLRRENKLNSIGMLAGGVAHEINNPLCGIIAFSQVLEKELRSQLEKNNEDKKLKEHLQDVGEILQAAKRCKNIVEDLLTFSRQEKPSHKQDDVTSFDIISCLENALRLSLLTSSRVKPKIDWVYEKPLMVEVSYQKLLQVFVNIFQNSVQAMDPSDAHLVIAAKKDKDGGCEVKIKDNGSGIDESILDKVFDPFFTTKDVGMGTGLGLSICHGIISEMGGKISASSKVGEGTTLLVKLPG